MEKQNNNKNLKIAGGIVVGLAIAGLVGYAVAKKSEKNNLEKKKIQNEGKK